MKLVKWLCILQLWDKSTHTAVFHACLLLGAFAFFINILVPLPPFITLSSTELYDCFLISRACLTRLLTDCETRADSPC